MPGRKWYAVAVLVFFLGTGLAGVFVFSRVQGIAAGLHQVVVPGEAEVAFEEPGHYVVYHEHESVVDGRYYSSEEIGGIEVRVVSGETGQSVALRSPGARSQYSVGAREGVSIFAFEIEAPGTYRVAGRYPEGAAGGPAVLAVGPGIGGRILMTVLGTLAIGLLGFLTAVLIAGGTYWKRRQASASGVHVALEG